MSRQDDLDRAKQAKQVLESPVWEEAFKRYEAKIMEQIKLANFRDRDLLDTLKRHLTSLSIVKRNLEVMIADGAEAKKKIDYEQTLSQRARSAIRRIA